MVQLVIPMSGAGERFIAEGYAPPKPLIAVDGKAMIAHVLSMFPDSSRPIFICRNDHLHHTALRSVLQELAPDGRILGIDPHKYGPVYAVAQAFSLLADEEAVMISYCDYFASWDYRSFRKSAVEEKWDGAVLAYKGFHPHLLLPNLYAGCKVDEDLNLTEIREKHSFTPNKMDTWQSSGAYYFANGALVKKYCTEAMERKLSLNGEYYISMVYSLLLRDQLQVKVVPQEFFCQWGTPEDLRIYKYWSQCFKAMQAGSYPQWKGEK
jgi:NDP-sugar pyrophosphorylase family protein